MEVVSFEEFRIRITKQFIQLDFQCYFSIIGVQGDEENFSFHRSGSILVCQVTYFILKRTKQSFVHLRLLHALSYVMIFGSLCTEKCHKQSQTHIVSPFEFSQEHLRIWMVLPVTLFLYYSMNLLHLQVYNDHYNPILQHFHPKPPFTLNMREIYMLFRAWLLLFSFLDPSISQPYVDRSQLAGDRLSLEGVVAVSGRPISFLGRRTLFQKQGPFAKKAAVEITGGNQLGQTGLLKASVHLSHW